MKQYLCPEGRRYHTCPRVVKLKSGKTVSLPATITDDVWKKIPGCKIIEVE